MMHPILYDDLVLSLRHAQLLHPLSSSLPWRADSGMRNEMPSVTLLQHQICVDRLQGSHTFRNRLRVSLLLCHCHDRPACDAFTLCVVGCHISRKMPVWAFNCCQDDFCIVLPASQATPTTSISTNSTNSISSQAAAPRASRGSSGLHPAACSSQAAPQPLRPGLPCLGSSCSGSASRHLVMAEQQ